MNKELLHKKIIEAIEDAGYEHRSYSGRAMYGKQCLGVVCENAVSTAVQIAGQLLNALRFDLSNDEFNDCFDDAITMLGRAKTDSFGLGTILYWPNIPPGEDEEGEDE